MDEELKKDEVGEEETKNAISADLIRGHINTIILRTLYERDKYGYEIIEEIASRRGFKLRADNLDVERASRTLIDDFRKGRLGKIMLEHC